MVEAGQQSYANIRVLVVDNNINVQKIFRPILIKDLGFIGENVYEANTTKKAYDMLSTIEFDLVVSEWDLPDGSGIDLLRRIRNSPQYARLPFMMVTSKSDQQHIIQAAEAKVSQYVIKPFSADDFGAKLQRVIKQERREHQRQGMAAKHELAVFYNGQQVSAGRILNVAKGGILSQLAIFRGLSVNDPVELKISLVDENSKKDAKIIQAELIRIEKIGGTDSKNMAFYAFMFLGVDEGTKKFLERILKSLESAQPKKV